MAFDCFYPLSTGGGERQYRLFAEAFAAEGWQVDYLTRRQWTDRPPLVEGVEVVDVSGPTRLYDDSGTRRPAGSLVFAAGLFRHLVRNRGRYDAVLVSALPTLNVLAARAALLGSGTAMCSDFLEVWRPEQWREYSGPVVGRVAAALQRLAVRVSPWVSAHSAMNAGRLRAEGARREPVRSPGLIHGVDHIAFVAEPSYPPTLVFAGRHIPDKQVDVIPAAVRFARQQVPGLRAVLLGDGPTREVVRARVEDLGLSGVIALPGFVSQEELEQTVGQAAVLVNPSRREGYGLVVVEACAAGTPVVLVAAEDNASTELVEEGVNGYVATSTAAEELGDAIVRAVQGGPALRQRARDWFEEAARTRTATAAAHAILAALASDGARGQRVDEG